MSLVPESEHLQKACADACKLLRLRGSYPHVVIMWNRDGAAQVTTNIEPADLLNAMDAVATDLRLDIHKFTYIDSDGKPMDPQPSDD